LPSDGGKESLWFPFFRQAARRPDEEFREINEEIQSGADRDSLEIASAWALRTRDLQKAILRHQPQIVHFSGLGDEVQGIFLEDHTGELQAVDREALAGLFEIFRDTIRVVILNACGSKHQVGAFSQLIDFTIGMNKPISDKAAVVFASSFYRGLAFGRTVEDAFRLAVNQLKIEGIPESDTPELLMREGANSSEPLLIRAQPGRDETIANLSVNNSQIGQVNIVKGDKNTFIA